MAIILTSTSETPEQMTEALTKAGHAVEVHTEGNAPEKTIEITATPTDKPAEKAADKPAEAETAPPSEAGGEKKVEETEEAGKTAKPEADSEEKPGEKVPADDPNAKLNRADRKLLKQVDKLTAQRGQLKETLEEREARILELEAKLSGKPTEESKPEPEAAKPTRPRMPVASDPAIAYDEEKLAEARTQYEADMDAYEVQNTEYIKAQTAKELRETTQKERQQQEAKVIEDGHLARVAEAKDRYDDWAEVTEALEDSGFLLQPVVYNGIMESEQGADIIHHLASNLDEAEKFSAMRPDRALREIGRLEAKFSDGGRKKPREKEVPAADADKKVETKPLEVDTPSEKKPPAEKPKPMSTLSGNAKPTVLSAGDIAQKQGSVAEYMRIRNAEREAKGLRP